MTALATLPASRRPVRSVRLAVASVSCSNSACMGVHRRASHVVPIVHQHGCSQVAGDLALTREILAGLMAHPNVSRSVVIGLGCEANQPDVLATRARRRGASVAVVGIQASGGVAAAIEDALALLADPATGRGPGAELTGPPLVGLMADESAGEPGALAVQAIARLLGARGSRVVTSVAASWRRGELGSSEALAAIEPRDASAFVIRAGATDVECLTALAACGAEVIVVVTACASPIGSPVAPTIKVSCASEIDELADVIDVAYADGAALAARTADAVAEVIAGRRTNAEQWGARDLAVWRIAPYF